MDMLLRKEVVSGATEYGIYHFNSSRRFRLDQCCEYVFWITDCSRSFLTAYTLFYTSKIDQALNGPEGCSASNDIWWRGCDPCRFWHIDTINDGSTQCDD